MAVRCPQWHGSHISAAVIYAYRSGDAHAETRGALHGGNLPCELLRMPEVVGVQKRDVLAFGDAYPAVASGGNSSVGGPEHPDTCIGDRGRNVGGTVAGAIVYHDGFKVGVGLGDQRPERLADRLRRVVGGDNNCDASHCRTAYA